MQIKLGQKIRELRYRDKRTQEDLADAVGVSPQAVSRWEAEGGYPDMELIPSIANYFHVTIDELFSYSGDRDEKIKSILKEADEALNAQKDMTECVSKLREAAEEFPSEPLILLRLGYALNIYGWQKYGAKSYTEDGSDYAHEDTEYNSKNIYWQEALKNFEKVLAMDIPSDDRDAVIHLMTVLYNNMGKYEKAKAVAEQQNSITVCREILLPKAATSEERDRYQGEAIIALMNELTQVIMSSVTTKMSLATTDKGQELLFSLTQMYEAIFDDGRCGKAHLNLRDIYRLAALSSARRGEMDKAMGFLGIALRHNKAYTSIGQSDLYRYTAPLVSKVTFPAESLPAIPENFMKGWIDIFPENLQELIRADPGYFE